MIIWSEKQWKRYCEQTNRKANEPLPTKPIEPLPPMPPRPAYTNPVNVGKPKDDKAWLVKVVFMLCLTAIVLTGMIASWPATAETPVKIEAPVKAKVHHKAKHRAKKKCHCSCKKAVDKVVKPIYKETHQPIMVEQVEERLTNVQ